MPSSDPFEQIERWFRRANLVRQLLPSSVLTAIVGIIGGIKDASFAALATGLIAAFTVPLLGLAALFYVLNQHKGRNESSEVENLRGDSYRPQAPNDTFAVIDAKPEPEPTDPNIIWKRKLRVAIRNRSGKQIEARSPDWICGKTYVPFEAHPDSRFWSILQPETSPGKFGKETDVLSVRPNGIFQTSVALDESYSVEEINNRRATQRVGMLIVPVTIDGREMEWRIRL